MSDVQADQSVVEGAAVSGGSGPGVLRALRELEAVILTALPEDVRRLAYALYQVAGLQYSSFPNLLVVRDELRVALEKVFAR